MLGEVVRKEGLEPSRCYPQVPETCASTSSATFAGGRRITPGALANQGPGMPRGTGFSRMLAARTGDPRVSSNPFGRWLRCFVPFIGQGPISKSGTESYPQWSNVCISPHFSRA
jgi:hypothetical protein